MSLYAFHLGQIISTVLGQVDHDGQHQPRTQALCVVLWLAWPLRGPRGSI
jgi:hypothetical protein